MRRRRRIAPYSLALGIASVLLPAVARAHPGRVPEPDDLWSAWSFAPAVILGLAGSAWLYARGLRALWTRAGRGRVVRPWRAAAFAAALASLALALLSPIDSVGSALFSVHMLQHLLLVMVAAPLMALGDPLLVMLWAFRTAARRRVGRWWHRTRLRGLWCLVRMAPIAWAIHILALWLWHIPRLYELAMRNDPVHVAEHLSFFLTALLFWWVVLAPHGRRIRAAPAMLYLFAAALQCTILGAATTFARRPWYPSHFGTTVAWGLNPLEDQQLAGLLMWIPAGTIYLVALLPLLWRMLGENDDGRPRRVYGAPSPAARSARGTP